MKRILMLAALVAGITPGGDPGAPSTPPTPVTPLWTNSFETENWVVAWQVTRDDWGADLRQHMSEPLSGGPASFLRVSYPAGSSSPASHRNYGTPEGGTEWYSKPVPPADVLHLRYYLRFAPGFGFNKGGKLPGLF